MAPEITDLALRHLWQVTLVVAAVLVVGRLVARRSPHLAHLLYLLALAKCLVPPLVTAPFALLGDPPASLRGDGAVVERVAHRDPASGTADVASASTDATVVPPERAAPLRRADESLESPALTEAPAEPVTSRDGLRTPRKRPAGSGDFEAHASRTTNDAPDDLAVAPRAETPPAAGAAWSLPRALAAVWALGALAVLVRALVAGWRVRSAVRRGTTSPELDARVAELAARLGVRRRVRVRILDAPIGPALLGVLRPTIVMPRKLVERSSAERRDLVLAHELVHLRRHDALVGRLALAARVVWWFHPLVRVALRDLTDVCERSCDREVVAGLACEPSRYARSLLEVLELKRGLRPVPASPGVSPYQITKRRLEDVMKLSTQRASRRTPRVAWFVVALAAVALLPAAAPVVSQEPEGRPGTPATPATPERPAKPTPASRAPDAREPAAPQEPAAPKPTTKTGPYRVRPLDRLRILLHPDSVMPSGEHQVEPDGRLSVGPQVGRILAAGKTFDEIEAEIVRAMRQYVREPRVAVTKLDWTAAPPAAGPVVPASPSTLTTTPPTEAAPQPAVPPAVAHAVSHAEPSSAGFFDELVRLATSYADAQRELEIAVFHETRARTLTEAGNATTDTLELARIDVRAAHKKIELLRKILAAAIEHTELEIQRAESELARVTALYKSALAPSRDVEEAKTRLTLAANRRELLSDLLAR